MNLKDYHRKIGQGLADLGSRLGARVPDNRRGDNMTSALEHCHWLYATELDVTTRELDRLE